MKILVTGGCGFIGSNIVEELVRRNHDVVVLDNLSLGRKESLKSVNGSVEIIEGDIRDEKIVSKAAGGCDIIFNEAAASSSPMFMKSLKDAVSVNVNGFINVLNAAKDNSARLIYASTSSIYGNSLPPLKEDMKTFPVNFYSTTKLMNEHFAALYSKEHGLETVGFRYMSVYGPHEESKRNFANLVTQFLWAMQKDEQPVIYGDGTQTRDFTYAKDVVHANILAMKSEKKFSGEVLNVGTGVPTSLNELVAVLNRLLKKNIMPKYVPNTVKNYIAAQETDISRIRDVLGFTPRFTLEDGIRDMIKLDRSCLNGMFCSP